MEHKAQVMPYRFLECWRSLAEHFDCLDVKDLRLETCIVSVEG